MHDALWAGAVLAAAGAVASALLISRRYGAAAPAPADEEHALVAPRAVPEAA
jgi:hypothetical protein